MYTRTRRQCQKDTEEAKQIHNRYASVHPTRTCGGAYVPPLPIPPPTPPRSRPPVEDKPFMRRAFETSMVHPNSLQNAITYEISSSSGILWLMLRNPVVVTDEDGKETEYTELPDYMEETMEKELKRIDSTSGLSAGTMPDMDQLMADAFLERRDAEVSCGVLGMEIQVPIP